MTQVKFLHFAERIIFLFIAVIVISKNILLKKILKNFSEAKIF
jgi:hypothetical protein